MPFGYASFPLLVHRRAARRCSILLIDPNRSTRLDDPTQSAQGGTSAATNSKARNGHEKCARCYSEVEISHLGNARRSAEMPSAGRAFTPELMTRLIARGVQFAPLLLHTGVARLEDHEPPYEEFYRVPLETARQVNAAREAGKRVIAVGTTVVRALETVTDEAGTTHPGEGWTRLVITPQDQLGQRPIAQKGAALFQQVQVGHFRTKAILISAVKSCLRALRSLP